MKIAISSDSTVDLPKELLEKFKIHTLPFMVIMGQTEVADGEILPEEIFAFVKKENILPKTSAINEYQFENHFQDLLKDYDHVIHFSLSSEISAAYKNAVSVAQKHNNITIIDGRSLSTGTALLCIYARKLIDKGLSPAEIVSLVSERIPFVQASFALEKVDYLYKGGRCSRLAFIGANVLGIKPQIIVKDGAMIPGRKYRGNMQRVTTQYVNDTLYYYNNPDLDTIFITYTTATEEIIESIKKTLEERGFKNIYVTRAGATISSHCGENCLGILYINDGKK
ncbi:MAG: DegV family protein [Bacilli bacterium]|jgi:DegV family protein with EDD domain|nr:DegV family protein [Bacilli bacterium]NLN80128.1 DegV family protein [Erysipelotrichia bacterium]